MQKKHGMKGKMTAHMKKKAAEKMFSSKRSD